MTSFGITNQRSYANMVFDAYVSAEKGDFVRDVHEFNRASGGFACEDV